MDSPYAFNGGHDDLPWTHPNGWIALWIEQLIADVEALNLHHGIENSLDAKLDAALNTLDDVNQNNNVAAINSLEAFISAVTAQSGGKIPTADADDLIAQANLIITVLSAP